MYMYIINLSGIKRFDYPLISMLRHAIADGYAPRTEYGLATAESARCGGGGGGCERGQ